MRPRMPRTVSPSRSGKNSTSHQRGAGSTRGRCGQQTARGRRRRRAALRAADRGRDARTSSSESSGAGRLRFAAHEAARLRRREAGQRFPGAIDEQQTALAIEEKKRIGGALKESLPAKVVGIRGTGFALVHGGEPAYLAVCGDGPATHSNSSTYNTSRDRHQEHRPDATPAEGVAQDRPPVIEVRGAVHQADQEISNGRCQYMLTANSGSELGVMSGVSFLLRLRVSEKRRPGERVVDHHDVQHARDHGVHPAQFDELGAADR